MRTIIYLLLFFFTCVFSSAFAQQTLTEARKKEILAKEDFFLSYRILLSDYAFDVPEVNHELLRAARDQETAKNLYALGAASVVLGAVIVMIGIREVRDDRSWIPIEGYVTAAMGMGVIGGVGLPLISAGLHYDGRSRKHARLAKEIMP